ncbi:MAG TPA: CHAT domain-containing protein, partial [Caulobacteraceae bacterium]
YPLYWDYRSPSPLTVSQLQSASGPDAALLGANEAVVVWMVPAGSDKGLVFAVSKRGFAWARMGMSGAEISAAVKALRARLDPLGAVSGQDLAAAGQGPGSTSGAGGMTQGGASQGPAPMAPPASAGFDRAGSYRLYQALLGDPEIEKVIHGPGIDTLLIVPSGALTSLPPAVLVTQPPQGRDDDPAALAATPWLIKQDAIAVLPQVAALKTLRQLLPASRNASGSAQASRPLLALADPDFAGVGAVPGVFPGRDPYVLDAGPSQKSADRGAPPAAAAERDGRSRAAVLAELPPLWDTRREGVELMTLLHADRADLLLGPAATKTALLQRQADHSLAEVKVLDFSTHGLITGDFAGLTEPALVLAAPPAGTDPAKDDQLLRASEAAGLTLSADWVVLSACNTAAGESPGAEGLSGLARAFFHAGARSLLVSHWRVDDAATEQLIATTFEGYKSGSPSKAKALQAAMTAMIADPASANPALWAPFVIVGEPR